MGVSSLLGNLKQLIAPQSCKSTPNQTKLTIIGVKRYIVEDLSRVQSNPIAHNYHPDLIRSRKLFYKTNTTHYDVETSYFTNQKFLPCA